MRKREHADEGGECAGKESVSLMAPPVNAFLQRHVLRGRLLRDMPRNHAMRSRISTA